MTRELITTAEAKQKGLLNPVTALLHEDYAHNGSLDTYVTDAIRAGKSAAIVVVKTTSRGRWVEVWDNKPLLDHKARYKRSYQRTHEAMGTFTRKLIPAGRH